MRNEQWKVLETDDVETPEGNIMPPGESAQRIRANAHLIAAAPGLLALAKCLEWAGMTEDPGDFPGWVACCPCCDGLEPVLAPLGEYEGHAVTCALAAIIRRAEVDSR